MATLVAEGLEDHGTRLIHESVPTRIEKQGERLMVEWTGKGDQTSQKESFDTVLMAIGKCSSSELPMSIKKTFVFRPLKRCYCQLIGSWPLYVFLVSI